MAAAQWYGSVSILQETPGRRQDVSTNTPARPSQVISHQKLRETDHYTDWALAGLAFVVTTIGTIGIGVNITQLAQSRYWTEHPIRIAIAIVLGIAYQYVVQRRQFANCHDKAGWRYRSALAASVIPSCFTFWPLLVPWLCAPLVANDTAWYIVYLAYGVAGAIVAIAMLVVDVFQEIILVRK
jgi:hypothetical protein